MSNTGPLNGRPIACTLTPSAGKEQVEKWRAFDDDYLLSIERTATEVIIRYTKVEDSLIRLRALVAGENACCSFVNWTIDDTQVDLRLIVAGTPEQLAALTVTSQPPAPEVTADVRSSGSPSGQEPMKAELLVVPSCPNERPAREAFTRALQDAGIEATVKTVVIDDEAHAQARGFVGSPSFFADDDDLLPTAAAKPGVSCRVYPNTAGLSGVPEHAILVEAIIDRAR